METQLIDRGGRLDTPRQPVRPAPRGRRGDQRGGACNGLAACGADRGEVENRSLNDDALVDGVLAAMRGRCAQSGRCGPYATLESVTGAVIVVAVVGLFLDGTARPMMGGIAACAVATFALAQRSLGRASAVVEPAL